MSNGDTWEQPEPLRSQSQQMPDRTAVKLMQNARRRRMLCYLSERAPKYRFTILSRI